jgi:hypothetical protein
MKHTGRERSFNQSKIFIFSETQALSYVALMVPIHHKNVAFMVKLNVSARYELLFVQETQQSHAPFPSLPCLCLRNAFQVTLWYNKHQSNIRVAVAVSGQTTTFYLYRKSYRTP